MSDQSAWQRALNRYGDTVYRLALLRDPRPAIASQATATAFTALDWQTITLDERLESRLLQSLCAPPRLRSKLALPRRSKRLSLAPLPSDFWRLPPAARVALGLRLTRGYDSDAIAVVLGRPVEEIRSLLVDTLALLAEEDEEALPEACRRSRALRLDDPAADRPHLRGCEACRAALPRWDRTEQALAAAMLQATGTLTLPRKEVEHLALQLGKSAHPPVARWHQPGMLSAAVIVVVAVVIAILVLPRRENVVASHAPASPRELLQRALERYGATPGGEGVVHRTFVFDADPSQPPLQAESWIDSAQPSRHRMQLATGGKVLEWQVGDGERLFRYLANDADVCGTYYASSALNLGTINTWHLDPSEQAMLRETRWQFGPWAGGYHFIEAALSAQSVRSLGSTQDGGQAVLTLAAEGSTISGTLLIKVDPQTTDLREVREIMADNGTTRSRTAWRLVSEQRLKPEEVKDQAIFYDVPVKPLPEEIDRSAPVLDPACPELSARNVASPIETLARGWPPLVGFQTPPAGTQRVFLAGSNRRRGGSGESGPPYDATLVYVGARKRLQISAGFNRAYHVSPGTTVQNWTVELRAVGIGRLKGEAESAQGSAGNEWPEFAFFSEGWTKQELLQLLATARRLQLDDVMAQRSLFYDPNAPPSAVIDLVMPAAKALAPAPGRVLHTVVEDDLRAQPGTPALGDPYHAQPVSGTTEAWVEYGPGGAVARLRAETRGPGDRLETVQWGTAEKVQFYDARTNLVRDLPASMVTRDPVAGIRGSLADILRYRQFEVSKDSAGMVRLQSTVPLTATDLQRAVQVQRSPESSSASGMWPYLADLDPHAISYRAVFERDTRRLVAFHIYADSSTASTLIRRTVVRAFETLREAPRGVWNFTPPAGAQTVAMEDGNTGIARREPRVVMTLAEASAAASAPLWGWPEAGNVHFVVAIVPGSTLPPALSAQTPQAMVESGVAVDLRYKIGANDNVTLVEGPVELMTALLRQTPAGWFQSEARTLRIGGSDVKAWVLRGQPQEHWIIFEIGRTLILGHYSGSEAESQIWSRLEDLVPLE